MENKKLTLVATIEAKEGKREFIKEELLKLIEPTRAEDGCINYDLHVDNKNENCFIFIENWASYEQWQAHMATSHIKAYMAASEGAVESFTVTEATQIA